MPRAVLLVMIVALWGLMSALGLGACDGGEAQTGSSPAASVASCEASCEAQVAGCPTMDVDLCQFGCAALANLNSGCRELLTARTECERQVAWTCRPTSEFVAETVDPAACAAEDEAFEAGCPLGGLAP